MSENISPLPPEVDLESDGETPSLPASTKCDSATMSQDSETGIESSDHVTIPACAPQITVRVVTLDTYSSVKGSKSSLRYLHRLRSGELAPIPDMLEREKDAYYADLHKHKQRFVMRLQSFSWNLLVEAPSSKPHAKDFADAARSVHGDSAEIKFIKTGNSSATKGASLEQLVESFDYTPKLSLSEFLEVLIVDDILAAGKTATAMILKLRRAGLRADARLTVAVGLRILPSVRTPRSYW